MVEPVDGGQKKPHDTDVIGQRMVTYGHWYDIDVIVLCKTCGVGVNFWIHVSNLTQRDVVNLA